MMQSLNEQLTHLFAICFHRTLECWHMAGGCRLRREIAGQLSNDTGDR